MASYAEIQARIAQLQQEAEALRKNERAAVIADLKARIAQYGFSARDLGLDTAPPRAARAKASGRRFVGPNGQSWSGRGRQPRWLHEALAAGMSKADFAA